MPRLTEEDLKEVSGGVSARSYKSYTVRKDDTLKKIAMHFGTTVDLLIVLNPRLKSNDQLIVGMELLVPQAG